MQKREEILREIVRGLDGLVLLGKWEVSLAEDLRAKAESLLARPQKGDPQAQGPRAGRD
jgi:hypothetical protein